MLLNNDGEILETNNYAKSFIPTLQPKKGNLSANQEGYLIMIDSPWENLPKVIKAERGPYMQVTLDVYCPGKQIQIVREESLENGLNIMEQNIRNHLDLKGQQIMQ